MAKKFSEAKKKQVKRVSKKAASRVASRPPAKPPASLKLSVKKTNAWMQAGKSERAGHEMVKKNPPKVSTAKTVADYVSGKVVPKSAKKKKAKVADML